MSREGYVQTNVRNVQSDIRHAVVADALDRQVTLSDVVGEVLATYYKVPFALSGNRPVGLTVNGADQFLLFMPGDIVDRVVLDSRRSRTTMSSVIQSALARHYGLVFSPVDRSRR